MSARSIVQIATISTGEGIYGHLIYALCDDGSLWEWNRKWRLIDTRVITETPTAELHKIRDT